MDDYQQRSSHPKDHLLWAPPFVQAVAFWRALTQDVLLPLIAQTGGWGKVLRFWTADCATGQEPYALALVLSDLLGSQPDTCNVTIFATDVDEASLAIARHGWYPESLFTGLPTDVLQRFFVREGSGFRTTTTIRGMVTFGRHDLFQDPPLPRIALLRCHSRLDSLSLQEQDEVFKRFAFALRPGYLVWDPAEVIQPPEALFARVMAPGTVYRRKAQTCAEDEQPLMGRASVSTQGEEHLLKRKSMLSATKILLPFLPVNMIVINQAYQVVASYGQATELLHLSCGEEGQDFLQVLPCDLVAPVQTAIDAVLQQRAPMTLSEIAVDRADQPFWLSLSLVLLPSEAGPSPLVAISVSDVTSQVQARQQREAIRQTEARRVVQQLQQTISNLTQANFALQKANQALADEHEAITRELEELQLVNEELQSSNEEEAVNNEELTTRTEELEAAIEQLTTEQGPKRAKVTQCVSTQSTV